MPVCSSFLVWFWRCFFSYVLFYNALNAFDFHFMFSFLIFFWFLLLFAPFGRPFPPLFLLPFFRRHGLVKWFGVCLAVASGLAVGPEGPMIFIGASAGVWSSEGLVVGGFQRTIVFEVFLWLCFWKVVIFGMVKGVLVLILAVETITCGQ